MSLKPPTFPYIIYVIDEDDDTEIIIKLFHFIGEIIWQIKNTLLITQIIQFMHQCTIICCR